MLRGEKVFLRDVIEQDLAILLSWENNPDNWKYGNTQGKYKAKELLAFIQEQKSLENDLQKRFMICKLKDKTPVGTIDLFEFDALNKRVGVGVLIDKPYRQKGYATESIMLIEEFCKIILDLKNIYCHILENNENSIQLFKKVGFIEIGKYKNWTKVNNQWYNQLIFQKEI